MWRRKATVVLCSLVLVLASACGGGGGNGDNNGNASQENKTGTEVEQQNEGAVNSEANGEQQAANNPNATPEMDFDMGGRTIKLASWYDESIKGDNPDSIQAKERLEALMKKHNFKVEYVVIDYGEYRDKVKASLLAGEPVGDIIRLARPWMIPSLVKQDLFWPVDEYTKNDRVFLQQYTNEFSQYKGRGYGFRVGISGAANGIIYNRTLMHRLGLKPLQDYVDEDNWNWETFIQVAKDANRDTNNDGKLDTWGLATHSLLVPALASNDANLVKEDKQNLEDPKTVEVLNFLSRLVTEQAARPSEGGDWTEPRQFFVQGNTLMFPGSDYDMDSLRKDMPDYDIGFLPFPKGPSADGYRSYNTIPNYYTIPKAVEHPEQIVYIWEKIFDFDSIYDYLHQANFEKFFVTEEDINNARMAVETFRVLDTNEGYPSMPYYEFIGELLDGVSVSTVIEKYKAPFQSAIDEVWKE